MGVNCDNSAIYIAVVEDGRVADGLTEKIENPQGLEEEGRLVAVYEDSGRVLEEIGPDRVVLLRPEPTYPSSHESFTPRITMESLLRLAAVMKGIPLDRMSRQGLRAALTLPKKGKLNSYLPSVLGDPVGGSWNSGRGLAAMAALASEKA